MAYAPIALTMPQYEDYATYWLKGYDQGTTTPLSMATDATGGTLLVKCEIDAQGFPETAGSARFIPFFNADYDLWMFPTEAEADANDTTNAIQLADNLNTDAAGTLRADLASTDSGKGAELVEYTSPGSGASASTVEGRLDLLGVDIRELGAVCDGITDDTTAINNASIYSNSVGLPLIISGKCYITDKITFFTGQRIMGFDRTETGFSVDDNFNLLATGIIDFGSTEPGPTVTDIGIFCDQDQTETVRANITAYPPAILAQDCPRFMIDRLRIEGATTGIDMTGNSGGAHIKTAEICALTVGIDTNGSRDYVFIDNVEFWPFGIGSGNLYTSVYSDGTNIGLNCIDVDGIAIGTLSPFRVKTVFNSTFGTVGCINADSFYAGVDVENGSWLAISSMYSSNNKDDGYSIKVSGADTHCTVSNSWIEDAAAATDGLIQVLTDSTANLIISNLWTRITGSASRIIYQTSGHLRVDSCYFTLPVNTTMTRDIIDIDGGRFNITDVSATDKGTGTGNLIGIALDNRHSISNVIAPGWPVSIPASSNLIKTSGNDFATKTSGTRELVERFTYVYTGSLTAGAATVAHGLTTPNENYPDITVWEITSGVIRTLMTGVTIDATNINISGGTGTNTYEIVLQVRE